MTDFEKIRAAIWAGDWKIARFEALGSEVASQYCDAMGVPQFQADSRGSVYGYGDGGGNGAGSGCDGYDSGYGYGDGYGDCYGGGSGDEKRDGS